MDNLTHSLTGLMLSRTGLNRWYPRADLVLIVAANIPDIDILAIARGPLYYFEQHRGITHSFAALPVMAFLPVLLACAIGRTMRGWAAAWGISIIGVLSHLLLDLTNTYGVRLLYPFSSQWFHLDLNNLFELLIWAVLLLGWLGPLMGKLVNSEIGAKSGIRPRHGDIRSVVLPDLRFRPIPLASARHRNLELALVQGRAAYARCGISHRGRQSLGVARMDRAAGVS